ncbi:long-chain-fatty-acid--CoA ligase [Chromatiales bacterium (ex Bugula neritina AB1)]|nr:long-chain-fatty-acid--CoA ligase [Chromatiales bacterium (ex Bugula neritina AB1)]
MIEKPWLDCYPEGVPEFIDTNAYQNIVELFEESVAKYRNNVAFVSMGAEITFGDLDNYSNAFAAWLHASGKFQKGDRMAVMMPNLLQYPIAVFGILRAGLTVVNTNPLYTARELQHQLEDSGAKGIVVVENFAHTLEEVLQNTNVDVVITTRIGDMLGFPKSLLVNSVIKYIKKMVPAFSLPDSLSFSSVLKEGSSMATPPSVALGHDDVAFLQYTGGTTGVAKGAMLSHGNMVANVQQSYEWLKPSNLEHGAEVIITALPLYHIFALTANCIVYAMLGSKNILILNPRDMNGFVKELKKYPFTAFTGVNTLFNGLLNTPGFADVDFSKLKLTLGGGMAVQESVADEWKKVTGCPLIEAYGLTETSPAACMNPITSTDYNGAIGLPISSTEACVMDPDGNKLPVGERGELCIRGPQVMKGYWQREEATAETIDSDSWLHTGDIAIMDDNGYFKIVDRLKDMILVSGFNVYPNEIENVIQGHPDVLEVGAIGVPDEHSGEAVKIYVVAKSKALTEDALKAYCRENLTGYKCPRFIAFTDELPKSNVGKILRRNLRELDAAN